MDRGSWIVDRGGSKRTIRLFLFALLALFPAQAWAAAALTCTADGQAVGTLYDTGATCQGVNGLENIFSGIVCDYQTVLDEVLRRVYCGMQASLRGPLAAIIIIYIAVMGVQFAAGMADTSYKELLLRLLKLSLVWTFATQAEWAINWGYNFFLSAMDLGISLSLKTIMPQAGLYSGWALPSATGGWTQNVAFRYMDAILYGSITGPFSDSGAKLAGLVMGLSYLIPPLFAMFVYFTIKTITIFVRALTTYLLSISAIAFLFVLSPIFFSFALFRTTFRFFDDWLRQVISFALQIILIFAGIALWISIMTKLGSFFLDLANIVVPVQEIVQAGAVRVPVDSWGVCPYGAAMQYPPVYGGGGQCNGNQIIYPSALVTNYQFMYFVTVNLLSLCIVAYAFDALIKQMPDLARKLSGHDSFPSLAGAGGMLEGGAIPGFGEALGSNNEDRLRQRRELADRDRQDKEQRKRNTRDNFVRQAENQVAKRD